MTAEWNPQGLEIFDYPKSRSVPSYMRKLKNKNRKPFKMKMICGCDMFSRLTLQCPGNFDYPNAVSKCTQKP